MTKTTVVKKIVYRSIGIIHTPFAQNVGVPIQPLAAKGITGEITIFPEYVEGLSDLEGFSHIILLYHLHLIKRYHLKVIPYMDNQLRGVFATRAPARPNAIGISVVRLLRIKSNTLFIENVDIVDGTPLLDIKPYVPEFDCFKIQKIGWVKNNISKLKRMKSDERFRNKG